MDQNREPRNKLTLLWSINVQQRRHMMRIYNGEKTSSSVNDLGQLDSYMQKNQTGLLSCHAQK